MAWKKFGERGRLSGQAGGTDTELPRGPAPKFSLMEAAIPTLRYAQVKRFYAEVLGIAIASEGKHHVFFTLGSTKLAVVDASGSDSSVRPTGRGIYLDLCVNDLNSVRRRLVADGTEILGEARDDFGVSLTVRDPAGNLLNIFQDGSF